LKIIFFNYCLQNLVVVQFVIRRWRRKNLATDAFPKCRIGVKLILRNRNRASTHNALSGNLSLLRQEHPVCRKVDNQRAFGSIGAAC